MSRGTDVREIIRAVPKTEIHLHLEALASVASIWTLIKKHKLDIPGIKTKRNLAKKFKIESLNEFIDLFINTIQVCFRENDDIDLLFDDALAYLKRNKGDRFWVVMDQTRLTSLKTILGQLGAKKSLEIIGAGGQTWPDNYGPHFRVHRRKVLYRERAELSETCGRFKTRLSKLKIPGKAGRYKGSGMLNNWWAGNCRAFVRAEREAINHSCSGAKPKSSAADCAAKVTEHGENAKLCRDALRALGGHYPYPRCFETYLNNKFMIVRFTS